MSNEIKFIQLKCSKDKYTNYCEEGGLNSYANNSIVFGEIYDATNNSYFYTLNYCKNQKLLNFANLSNPIDNDLDNSSSDGLEQTETYSLTLPQPTSEDNYTIIHNLGENPDFDHIPENTQVRIEFIPADGYKVNSFMVTLVNSGNSYIEENNSVYSSNMDDNTIISDVNISKISSGGGDEEPQPQEQTYNLNIINSNDYGKVEHNLEYGTETEVTNIPEGTEITLSFRPTNQVGFVLFNNEEITFTNNKYTFNIDCNVEIKVVNKSYSEEEITPGLDPLTPREN